MKLEMFNSDSSDSCRW